MLKMSHSPQFQVPSTPHTTSTIPIKVVMFMFCILFMYHVQSKIKVKAGVYINMDVNKCT
jgi:hypothetical protein